MVRSMTKRGMPKPFAMLLAALLALYVRSFVGRLPQAVDGRGFEIEGNLVDDTAPTRRSTGSTSAPVRRGSGPASTTSTPAARTPPRSRAPARSTTCRDESGAWPELAVRHGQRHRQVGLRPLGDLRLRRRQRPRVVLPRVRPRLRHRHRQVRVRAEPADPGPTTDANPDRSQGDIRLVVYDQGNGVVTLTAGRARTPTSACTSGTTPTRAPARSRPDTDQDGAGSRADQHRRVRGRVQHR